MISHYWRVAGPVDAASGVEPGGGQKYDGEHGKGADAEAVAERPAGNGAERGERDQDTRPNPGAGRDADRTARDSNAAA